MSKILIPTTSPEDWKMFLADPDKHWKTGYSARSMAHCWEEAGETPSDITRVLNTVPALNGFKTIFAIPEHKVSLPGGSRASQNDVWVLGEVKTGLVSVAVEGKVSETFGPTVGEWFESKTAGKEERLKFLCNELDIDFPPPPNLRYQLLHRTVSAILEAKRFRASEAVMVVHTFSRTNEWFEDYNYFLSLFGLSSEVNKAVRITLKNKINLSFAWVHGSEKYLTL